MKKKYSVGIVCLLVALMVLSSCMSQKTIEPSGDFEDIASGESAQQIQYVSEYAMSYPERSIEELVEHSALIVRAKMLRLAPSENRRNIVVTDHVFEVLEVYSGDKNVGDKIVVEMIGGVLGDTQYISNNQKAVKIGDEVTLILSYPTDANDEILSKDYYVYYPPAGIYYKNDQVIASHDETVFVANDPRFTFSLDSVKAEINRIVENVKE